MKIKNDGEIKFKVSLDGNEAKSSLDKLGSIGKKSFKAISAGVVATGTALTGLISKSVQMAGELEQQIGGTEAVFKEFASEVQKQSEKAYSSMGLSANSYMATMNKMGALMQGSGISIETSMNLSSQAMQRAADVASIMGIDVETAMESIAGAAKGNFTMMDNLGVAMNATTIEAYAMSKGIDKTYDSMSNAEKVQYAMEMFLERTTYAMGNYTKENETFAGSLSTMKASISNFMSGAGDINSVIESVTSFINILINSIGQMAPAIINGIVNALPQILESGSQIIFSLIEGIGNQKDQLVDTIFNTMTMLLNGIINMLPDILQLGIEIIIQLINGLAEQAPELIPTIIECLLLLIDTILDNIDIFIDAGINLILALADGLIEALPILIEKAPIIIQKLIDAIIRNFPKIVSAGGELLGKLIMGISGSIYKLLEVAPQLISTIVNGIKNGYKELKNVGKYLIEGLWKGISGMADWVYDKVSSFADNIASNVKKALGIHSPSKVFFEIGGYLDEGFIDGIKDMEDDVNKQLDSTFGSGLDYLYNGYDNFNSNMPDTSYTSIPNQTIFVNNSNNTNTRLEVDGKVLAETVNTYNEEREVAV